MMAEIDLARYISTAGALSIPTRISTARATTKTATPCWRAPGRQACARCSPSASATARTPCTARLKSAANTQASPKRRAFSPAPAFIRTKRSSADEAAYAKLDACCRSRKSSPAAKSDSTTSTTIRRARRRKPSFRQQWKSPRRTRSRSSSTAALRQQHQRLGRHPGHDRNRVGSTRASAASCTVSPANGTRPAAMDLRLPHLLRRQHHFSESPAHPGCGRAGPA